MERYLKKIIYKDSQDKIVLLSGARQTGKTTLVKSLFKNYSYFSYDLEEDRAMIRSKQWRRDSECVIFDELHKMSEWKRWIKGIYDTEGLKPKIVITGSVNVESFMKVGDSLAGRYFHLRLHPIDLKEGVAFWNRDPQIVLNRLLDYSGFPEPFLKGSSQFYRRWQRTHMDVILRQDFLDLYAVRSIKMIELLCDLLKPRVSSTLSIYNLANDLQVDSKTVKNWLQLLSNFYIVFRVSSYHKNIARSILKEPKYYFFDIGRVKDIGAKIENLVACSLLKEVNFVEDTEGLKSELHYLRTKDGKELDFLITVDDKPVICFEVKLSDSIPSQSFNHFRKYLNIPENIQLVLGLQKEFDTQDGIKVRNLEQFLSKFSLTKYLF
ncbi:MAG: ATP-binding protein [Rickettsiales bacterium]|nr:ATP-binding protein [Rickettsiales bacterium]